MKKIFLFILILTILTSVAYAELCTDSDDGLTYDEKGDTKYGITTKTDTCVISKQADMSVEESSFLKEYYCSDDARKFKIITCSEHKFISCKAGKCTAPEKTEETDDAVKTPRYVPISCGDKKLNQKSEECDPPGKICFKDGDVGQCDKNCKCEVMVSGVKEAEESEEETTEEKTEEKKTPAPRPPTDEREDLPAIGKKGFFARIWGWITGIFT